MNGVLLTVSQNYKNYAILGYLFSGILLFAGLYNRYLISKFKKKGVITQARVMDKYSRLRSNTDGKTMYFTRQYHLVLQFSVMQETVKQTIKTQTHRWITGKMFNQVKTNSRIDIVYLPNKPRTGVVVKTVLFHAEKQQNNCLIIGVQVLAVSAVLNLLLK